MKIVVVGGGVISRRIIESKYAPEGLIQFSIRDLQRSPEEWAEMQLACVNSDAIIFLAYHHKNIFLNIKLLFKVLSSLRRYQWLGKFIFLNTQTTLIPQIFVTPNPLPRFLTFDLYTVTKKIQSSLVSYFSKSINIFEIFLPVITGLGSKAHNRFLEISLHNFALIPNAANNYFAQLDLDDFVDWVWTSALGSGFAGENQLNGRVVKIFIYQKLISFKSFLVEIRKLRLESTQEISNLLLKYRFSNSFFGNLIWHIKMSPIGLLIYTVRYAYESPVAKGAENVNKQALGSMPQVFIPCGSEYQFLGSSIDLSRVPFEVLKID